MDRNFTFMAFHNTVYYCQPQTGPLSHFFGSEIGLKDPFHDLFVHTMAGVPDSQSDIFSGTQFGFA